LPFVGLSVPTERRRVSSPLRSKQPNIQKIHESLFRNYIPLQTIDKDGSSSYSKVVTVSLTTNNSPLITISPNPTKGPATITLTVPKSQTITYRLINTQGKPARTGSAKLPAGKSIFLIDLSGLAKGSYRLVLDGVGERQLMVE
jgi:hypothetical protein